MTEGGSTPPIVCVVGMKKSGKTTVAVALVSELIRRGRRVMTVKHGHGFELDTPGTDSWRHRHDGGAHRVVMAGPADFAVVGGWEGGGELGVEELAQRYLGDAELVVAEGYKTSPFPKIDVYRSAAHPDPLYRPDAPDASSFIAVVTDREDFEAPVPLFSLDDPDLAAKLADLVAATFLL
jgi:molybdopterin-guanine dinucleotide biosynthesis protein B